ncbi:KR domain-containing protein [Streptomyces sp. GKU 257-1]|nr:KR domain-containing protein [Streptomyces sp. GKU 257-1]
MREHGVRRLVLVSRRGAEATSDLTAELAAAGCEATTLGCDPADRDALRSALAGIPRRVRPHRRRARGGCPRRRSRHLPDARKAHDRAAPQGGCRLEPARAHPRRAAPLTAFVLVSSVSGVLGGAGQANYAAANAFLDALAVHRADLGLPGQSHAWGLWDQDDRSGGMASGLDTTDRARLARLGVAPLPEDQALALFDRAVADPGPFVVPTRLDLRRVREQAESEEAPALLRGLVPPARSAGGDGTFTERLTALAPDERLDPALELVRGLAAAVLGHASADRVPATRAFRDAGFDSLGALELRNRLNNATGLRLPAGLVFDHPTPTELAAHLVDQLPGPRPGRRSPPRPPPPPTNPSRSSAWPAVIPAASPAPGNSGSWPPPAPTASAVSRRTAAGTSTGSTTPTRTTPAPRTPVKGASSTTRATSTRASSGSRRVRRWRWTRSSGCSSKPPGKPSNRRASTPTACTAAAPGCSRGRSTTTTHRPRSGPPDTSRACS